MSRRTANPSNSLRLWERIQMVHSNKSPVIKLVFVAQERKKERKKEIRDTKDP